MNETTEQKDNELLDQPTEEKLLDSDEQTKLLLEHPSYKKLEEQLSAIEEKVNEYRNRTLLLQADLENTGRRAERDITNAHKYGVEKFAKELLAVVDNLERCLGTKAAENLALKDTYLGIELTLKMFLEVLQKFGIVPIDPKNELFNPEKHTAIMVKDDPNFAANTVIEVVQKGYWIKDRLLRPAMVIVASENKG